MKAKLLSFSIIQLIRLCGIAGKKNVKGYSISGGFPGGSVVKNPPANAGDLGLTLWMGKGNGYLLSILAWEIPWTEKPGGL